MCVCVYFVDIEKSLDRIPQKVIEWGMRNKGLPEIIVGAATPGFNSLVPAPSVPSLVSTEPAELLYRASSISTADPFCFVKQQQKTVEAFLQFFLQICAAPPSVRRTKIHGDKGYHTALK